jgi:hypothetical protein
LAAFLESAEAILIATAALEDEFEALADVRIEVEG